MSTEEFFEFVEELKASDFKSHYLRKYKPQKYIDCMMAFETCFYNWVAQKESTVTLTDSFKDKFFRAWLGVNLDLKKMSLLVGPNLLDIFDQLKRSFAIYPDGSLNTDALVFFETRQIVKEKRK